MSDKAIDTIFRFSFLVIGCTFVALAFGGYAGFAVFFLSMAHGK
jgi:hypothetical protein